MEKKIFEFFTALLEKVAGISYATGKEYLIESRLNELALSLGYKDVKDIYQTIIKKGVNLKLLNEIIDALTTNETYFFRDYHPFEALRTHILPELFKKREKEKKINIWSAACATGQEAYSIAMILLEYFSLYLQTYRVSILATDISKKCLEKAKKGVYNQIEINRGLPISFLVKYFKQCGAHWYIDEKVKKLVKFEKLNLLGASQRLLERFDLIFCRYVLIYFSDEIKKKVLTDLWKLLNPGGYLILGATEIPALVFSDMEKKIIGKTSWYHKKG
ncbi:MAG: Methylase of chemotaxis methyl-accepting proteins [Thermodesulfobacteria bacterium]|nr:protein-glutamate O-methyltransferase CheR [Thermodesulfobacteriota bacterium]MCU4138289.1 Methylase of chemotaxis methyl-accepting proteins [Thermodesulfobacteriota bacterium]